MNEGTVGQFNSQKGYGFTISEENGMDISVHFSGTVSGGFKPLEEGQAITFDITNSSRGLRTVNVCAT